MLTRYFTLNPLMVRPRSKVTLLSGTVDGGDFLLRACPDPGDIYVVEDPDEIFHIGAVEPSDPNSPPNKASALRAARWAALNTNKYHRSFIKHRIHLHYTDCSSNWKQVERDSDQVVDSILSLLRFRPVLLILEWKVNLQRIRWALRHSRAGSAAVRLIRRVQSYLGRPHTSRTSV